MKRILFCISFALTTYLVDAQSPQSFTFQAVVRNNSNILVSNSPVGVRISILQGDISGPSIYTETHLSNTNTNGLLTLAIGNGTVVNGSFSSINWGNGPYFIKKETDPTGGTNYTIIGTSQLMSVPYALYAENSGTPGPQGNPGADGIDGNNGLSAYQIWLNLGNTGTEADFIASLTGPQGIQGPAGNAGAQGLQGLPGTNGLNGTDGVDGNDGLSAYQIWLNLGNTGTEADFIASLTGPQGIQGLVGPQGLPGTNGTNGTNGLNGVDGNNGLSAYQIWLNLGNTGTETDFIASLTGPQGIQGLVGPQGLPGTNGTNGLNGADGADGNNGLSAYQIWLNLGNTGTEADFIASLTGPQGIQGPAGNDGAQGLEGLPGTNGLNGADGVDGNDGLSAYQIWLNLGNTGTEADFIASLTGPAGADATYNTVAFKTTMEINRPVNGTIAMVFDSVLFNQGNAWDPIQNIFTAPEQGFYSFSAFLIVGGIPQMGGVYFYVNGVVKGFHSNNFQYEPYMHGTILLHLNQGDIVQPYYQGGSVTLNGHPTFPAYATYFEGFKVN